MSPDQVAMDSRARSTIRNLTVYRPGTSIAEGKRQTKRTRVIKLASNENALGPSPKALAAIQRSAGSLNRYPDVTCAALRQKLSQHLGVPLDELIVDTVEQELIGKGYMKNTSGDPELRIDYGVIRKSRPDETGHGWHEEGALILDIIDPGSGQRYWRGIAQARLHDDDSPKVRRRRISEAIREMLAQFPAADREID